MKKYMIGVAITFALLTACNDDEEKIVRENPSSFTEVGNIDLGNTGASEITAYDPKTKRLFVVCNDGSSRIDVLDLSSPASPSKIQTIDILPYGSGVNSVAVKNGRLAAAIEATNKQDNGKVVIFDTQNLSVVQQVTVGAMPDMITYSPDGKFILTANEGEPNSSYTNDPEGSVSIISVNENYSVVTLNFSRFANNETALKAKGFRIFGPRATFAKDIEPEYVAISDDSKMAWVTLQENNAIAKIDLATKSIVDIMPLGTKDHNIAGNELDPSDRDNKVELRLARVKGYYMPDAIAYFKVGGVDYIITANEGDTREYEAYVEDKRIKDIKLDESKFPDFATLRRDENLGRLKMTPTAGDIDGDGDFDEIYIIGARSFGIWNAQSGALVYDAKDMEKNLIAGQPSLYDDTRSDDKGVEPEAITVAKMGDKLIAFVGLERADAVMIYDISSPTAPQLLQILKTGDAPEGVLYVPASESPNGKSMLVVSSEGDGTVKIYQPASSL